MIEVEELPPLAGVVARLRIDGENYVRVADIAELGGKVSKAPIESILVSKFIEDNPTLGVKIARRHAEKWGWYVNEKHQSKLETFVLDPSVIKESESKFFAIRNFHKKAAMTPSSTVASPTIIPGLPVGVAFPLAPSRPSGAPSDPQLVFITPQVAAELLKANTANRAVKWSRVADYARDIKAGNWQLNGDMIRIRADGLVADGQHRLLACVESGVGFWTYIITGLSVSATMTLDQGAKRTVGDQLTLAGEKYGNSVAATMRSLAIYAEWNYAAKLTVSEVETILALHPGVRDSSVASHHIPVITPSLAGAIHYIGTFAQKRPAEADQFLRVFQTGIPTYKGDPAHVLRERFVRAKMAKVEINLSVRMRQVAHAWNLFAAKKSITKFQLPDEVVLTKWNCEAMLKGFV